MSIFRLDTGGSASESAGLWALKSGFPHGVSRYGVLLTSVKPESMSTPSHAILEAGDIVLALGHLINSRSLRY